MADDELLTGAIAAEADRPELARADPAPHGLRVELQLPRHLIHGLRIGASEISAPSWELVTRR